ncbi:hypothetical protein [Roseateles sp. LKC17W]|uniref:Uncharacterized protein n=1 Tax=Pelomonas margarita TaxID=3299031 RepID=A0ABW7FID7_9BURK
MTEIQSPQPAPLQQPSGALPDDCQAQQADAWSAVCKALHEVAPGWLDPKGTGQDLAVATIRRLAAAVPPAALPEFDALSDALIDQACDAGSVLRVDLMRAWEVIREANEFGSVGLKLPNGEYIYPLDYGIPSLLTRQVWKFHLAAQAAVPSPEGAELSDEQILAVIQQIDPAHAYMPAALKQFARAVIKAARAALAAQPASTHPVDTSSAEWRCPATGRTCTAEDCGRECETRDPAESYEAPATAPNLACPSVQARLAEQWGYVRPAAEGDVAKLIATLRTLGRDDVLNGLVERKVLRGDERESIEAIQSAAMKAAAALEAHQPHVQPKGTVPAGFVLFPAAARSDVLTAAGLLRHGKQCKALADRLGEAVASSWDAGLAAQSPAVGADALPALRKLVEQIDKAEFVDENGHPIKMNAAYLAAKELL